MLNMILSDLRCERITGHDAVTGDTGGAERAGIYTDEHHYSQMITQGRSLFSWGITLENWKIFGELGIKKGRISLLLQSSLERPQSFPVPGISLRGLLQSSKLAQGRRELVGECTRVDTGGTGRLLFLCMIILNAGRPES